ncbi:glycosyltransferase family 39 protein [Candidatus Woesearchaeota archaeon]|nr:glycosyltransferase family 39 protein [Candidatus Woesearchaeota archaeon]
MPPMLILAASLLMLVIFLTVTFAIGRRILALFKADLSSLEDFIISTAIGAAALINITILLGTLKILHKEAYLIIAAAVALLFLKEVKRLLSLLRLLAGYLRQTLKPGLAGILLAAYLLFALINIAPTLTPVYEFDSMVYHLAFAKEYAGSHSLVYQPSQVYATIPQGMTMLYTISELFSTPNLSPLIAYSFGLLASLAIYTLVRKRHSEISALAGSLLFFTAPAVIERLPQTMVDTSMTYFFLAAVIVLFKYASEENENRRTLLTALISILIGTAISVKLTGVFAAGAFLAGMPLSRLLYKSGLNAKQLAKEMAIFAFIALILLSPWLLRGYIYTGNPVYPLAYNLFGGKYLDPSMNQAYGTYHESVGMARNIPNSLLVLWNITFKSGALGAVIGLTPFFIMLLPLMALFYRHAKDLKKWALMTLMGMAALTSMFVAQPVLRYMFPGIALLSASTAMTIEALPRHRLLKAAVMAMLLASLAFNAAIWYGINAKSIHYFAAGESESGYYSKLKDYNAYDAAAWINANTGQDSTVLLFNEPRGYFLNRKHIVSSPYQNYIDYRSMSTSTELLARLKELNISHILVNGELFNTYEKTISGSKTVGLMHNLTAPLTPVYQRGGIAVYGI